MANTFDDLLDAVKTKLEGITGVNEVIVGTYNPVELGHRASSLFNCISILYRETRSDGHIDQRNMHIDYEFEIEGHTKADSPSRTTGTDMKTIETLGANIRSKLYSFLDDISPPCTNYLMTNGDFTTRAFYREHNPNLNSVVVVMSFKVHMADTTL